MNAQDYIKLIEDRLSCYFDRKEAPAGLPCDLVAELNASDEGYLLIKKLKTYSVKHNEYLYMKVFDKPLTMADVEPYIDHLQERMRALKTTTEHMSSLFMLVLVCEAETDPATIKQLEGFKFHKDYAFSLKGWADLAIYIVNPSEKQLSYNKAGKKTAQYFALQ